MSSYRTLLDRLRYFVALFVCTSIFLTCIACNKTANLNKEVAYVNAPQVFLRDRLAPIFEKKGMVYLGDKVYVLEHKPRFARVRTERGEEGWIADRYLVTAEDYAQFTKLQTENAKTPVQAHGTARNLLNLHLTPGRDTEHLFQLQEGDKVEVLKRATAEKPKSMQPAPAALRKLSKKDEEAAGPALEDWLLIRGGDKQRVGWVLARMVDVDVPLEIAQYAEGQRIVASFVINQVQDADKKVPQYLVLLTDNKDGLAWDYNQIRVFTWNLKRHRYETAYREHDLNGFFPVSVGSADFGKDGVEPTFTLKVKDLQGQENDRKYRMIGPIVRRVATPQEQQKDAAERAARRAAQHGKKRK